MRLRPTSRYVEWAVAVVAVAIAVSQALVYLPGVRNELDVSLTVRQTAPTTVEVTSEVTANFAAHINQLSLVENGTLTTRPVLFFFDPQYPSAWSDIPDWYGLTQHLTQVAAERHYPLHLILVSAEELVHDLRDPGLRSAVLVMASGAFPAPVFSRSLDLVSPWVRGGGTLIWMGDLIGLYSAQPGHRLACGDPTDPGLNGTSRFLDLTWFRGATGRCPGGGVGGSVTLFPTPSTAARALGLSLPGAITWACPDAGAVINGGGTVFGNLNSGLTNVALVPLGNGSVLNIGAPAYDVLGLSYVIDTLLQTGALVGRAAFPQLVPLTLAPGQTLRSTLSVQLPTWVSPGQSSTFCQVVLQTDYLATFLTQDCIPV